MISRSRFAVIFILLAELMSVPSFADDAAANHASAIDASAKDALGTAGPIRSFGTGKCDRGYAARQRGECDPPAIASDLPADIRSRQRAARAQQLVGIMRTEPATRELDTAITEDPANTPALLLRARLRISGQLTDALLISTGCCSSNPTMLTRWRRRPSS
jgi:hypothetical protein